MTNSYISKTMRNVKDAQFIKTKANASGGANSDTIDLGQVLGGNVEALQVELAMPAEAGLSDTKVLTYTLKDSADGTTFATLDPVVAATQTGSGGTGAAAKTVNFRLPPSCRRYIRIEQTASATPGTLAGSFTVSLKF